MKRFTFRLERLLRLRTSAEREQAVALRGAELEAEERSREARDRARRATEAQDQVSRLQSGPMTAGTLSALHRALSVAGDHAAAAADRQREAARSAAEERARFEEARQARRSLERLRERRQGEWRREVSRLEQGQMDETASRRHQSDTDGS